VLTQGASVSDIIEIIVFDIFSVADTVSAGSGGNFAGNVGMGGTLAVTGNTTVGGTLGVTGVPTFTGRSVHSGGITVANAGQIGSVGDADAMAISSGGVVTFSQNTVGAGGMDLLLNSTISSAVAQFDITSTHINSTYDDYQVLATLFPASDNIHLIMNVFVGGTEQTGDIYSFEASANSSSTYLQSNAVHRFGLNVTAVGGNAGEGITLNFTCHNVNSTTHSFCYGGSAQSFSASAAPNSQEIGGSLVVGSKGVVVNGLRISFESGNITSGIVKVYGIRK